MNLCEIQKAIEQNTNDINSIKNNSESNDIYQVVIRVRPVTGLLGATQNPVVNPDPVSFIYDILKGDYETTLSKLQMGEYVDIKVFSWEHDIMQNDFCIVSRVFIEDGDIIIKVVSQSVSTTLMWTSEGITELHS